MGGRVVYRLSSDGAAGRRRTRGAPIAEFLELRR